MKVDVLLGLQWGDEGKGKIVDVLTPEYHVVARFQGGPNAGHTLAFDNQKYVLHTIPSGVFRKNCINIIGNGVVIDPVIFQKEVQSLENNGISLKTNLKISKKAHLILPTHRLLDVASEEAKGKQKIGSTQKGIGPTYMDKTGRNGIRVGDIFEDYFPEKLNRLIQKHVDLLSYYDYTPKNLEALKTEWLESLETLKSFEIVDSEQEINFLLNTGNKVLAEGAQGSLLDIDFGTYPYVTSSNTVCAGACTGLGIAPNRIGEVFGIFKAYCTRVGSGPFPTELNDETGELLRKKGHEFGATTGRARRCGWLDLVALKYAVMINGVTQLIMMKADVLNDFETIKICTHYCYKNSTIEHFPFDITGVQPVYKEMKGWNTSLEHITDYEDFPKEFKDYVQFIEEEVGVPVTIISIGPDRKQTVMRNMVNA